MQGSASELKIALGVKSKHYLAAFVDKYQLDSVVCIPRDRRNLARYPAEVLVGEPDLGTLAVYVFRHSGRWTEEYQVPAVTMQILWAGNVPRIWPRNSHDHLRRRADAQCHDDHKLRNSVDTGAS